MTTAEIRAQISDLIDQRDALDIQIARLTRRLEVAQESQITLNYGTLVPSPLSEYGMLLINAPDDCNKLVEVPE